MAGLSALLRYVETGVVSLLAWATVRSWLRDRHQVAQAWLAAAFVTITLALVASLVLPQTIERPLGLADPMQWAVKALVVVILAFPWCLFRFVGSMHPFGRTLRSGADLLSGVVALATLAIPTLQATADHHQPWWGRPFMALVFAQWALLAVSAAVGLWRLGRHKPTVARRRQQVLALASASLVLGLVPAAFQSNTDSASGTHLAGQVLGIVAVVLFAVGVSPPAVLRMVWRRPEEHALHLAQVRLMTATTAEEVVDALLPHLATILGDDGAVLVDGDGTVVARSGVGDDELAALLPAVTAVQAGTSPRLVAPGLVAVALSTRWLAVRTGISGPFFGREERQLLMTLAVFIELSLARTEQLERDRQQHLHDAMTGLANRTLLLDRLEQQLARARDTGRAVAVLFCDLDRFKWVNDSLGHAAGDEVLVAVARRLEAAVRPGDTVARLGGDEFVVVCGGVTDEGHAARLASQLADAVSAPDPAGRIEVGQTASIGIALARPGSETSAYALLLEADAAMYHAKQAGRNRWEVSRDATRNRFSARMGLEERLRRAIDDGDIEAHFQPQVDLATGRVRGFEALARWRGPDGSLVMPGDFIPTAEETGLIVPLGLQLLASACRQAAAWQAAGEPSEVSINLSAREVVNPALVPAVADILEVSGLRPASLCVEITESVLLADADSSRRALDGLKELGLRIAVDDFGTGYSSLLYLKQLPVDAVKVDRSFVAGLGRSAADRAIVSGVIDLAHALGLSTVAEGVERVEQLDVLRELGCQLGQGFHWTPALGPGVVEAWVRSHRAVAGEGGEVHDPRVARLLLVDDDSRLRQVLKASVAASAVAVTEASDGRESIAVAREHQPDLVVLDLSLPGMGGLEALPRIQAVAPRSVVVVLSSHDAADMGDRAADAGAAAYFRKDREFDGLVDYLDLQLSAIAAGR